MSVQKESGESQGTKQTRGHDCLPFRGAAESSAYGVWRFRSALEISSEWLFSCQRSGSQLTMGLAEAGCEMRFTVLSLNSVSQVYHLSCLLNLVPKGFYCFQIPGLFHKQQWRITTWDVRVWGFGAKLAGAGRDKQTSPSHYNYWRCFENLLQISKRIYPKESPEWHWEEVHGNPMDQWGTWFLMLYFWRHGMNQPQVLFLRYQDSILIIIIIIYFRQNLLLA